MAILVSNVPGLPWGWLWNLLLGHRTQEGRTSGRSYGKIRDSEQSSVPQAHIPLAIILKKKYCIFEIRLPYIYNLHGGLPHLPLGYMNVHNYPLLFWKRVSQIISSHAVAISNINWPFLCVFFPKLNPSKSRGLICAFISPYMILYPSSFFITSESVL